MIFSTVHIAVTAALTAVLAAGVGLWQLPRRAWPHAVAVAVLAGAAVFLGGCRRTSPSSG